MIKKYKVTETFIPLYRKNDIFVITKLNKEKELMPIEAMRLKNKQIYIAVQKALLKLDSPTISFYLLEKKYPEWKNFSPSSFLLSEISKNIIK